MPGSNDHAAADLSWGVPACRARGGSSSSHPKNVVSSWVDVLGHPVSLGMAQRVWWRGRGLFVSGLSRGENIHAVLAQVVYSWVSCLPFIAATPSQAQTTRDLTSSAVFDLHAVGPGGSDDSIPTEALPFAARTAAELRGRYAFPFPLRARLALSRVIRASVANTVVRSRALGATSPRCIVMRAWPARWVISACCLLNGRSDSHASFRSHGDRVTVAKQECNAGFALGPGRC